MPVDAIWGNQVRYVLDHVFMERGRQESKWGEQNHADGTGRPDDSAVADRYRAITDFNAKQGHVTYRDILLEEVFEAIAESDKEKLKTELIQVAAVAVAWVEKLIREERKAAA